MGALRTIADGLAPSRWEAFYWGAKFGMFVLGTALYLDGRL